jgi:pimeloyl-ACP methyl ester carboxylesterase
VFSGRVPHGCAVIAAERTARAWLASARRRRFVLPERGVELAALEWGDGPLALLHHANGFCKGTWAAVAHALSTRWRVIAIDARGHGDSSKPSAPAAYAWDEFAADLVAVGDQLRAERGDAPLPLGIGHSFGGTSMIGAAARRPDLFERLLLVDPVIPPPPGAAGDRRPFVDRLVDGARRRRAEWPSRAAARAWCAERRFFAGWRPEAIELYLLDGMEERADGSLVLKCPGRIEAAVFAGSASLDLFARARAVQCPARLLWAARGDFPRPLFEAVAATMRCAEVEPVDCGHLVPMERPEIIVDLVARWGRSRTCVTGDPPPRRRESDRSMR